MAIVRRVITLDVKAPPATTLFGVASMRLALAAAYWLMRKSGGAPASALLIRQTRAACDRGPRKTDAADRRRRHF